MSINQGYNKINDSHKYSLIRNKILDTNCKLLSAINNKEIYVKNIEEVKKRISCNLYNLYIDSQEYGSFNIVFIVEKNREIKIVFENGEIKVEGNNIDIEELKKYINEKLETYKLLCRIEE